MRYFVIMGVSGCGKTTQGEAVAAETGYTFLDGDDLHPIANIEKMASGIPLTDEDRAPWLDKVGRTLGATPGATIIGCSALKRRYRDRIRAAAGGPVGFLHLAAPFDVIAGRMATRAGHFMPPKLLQSQFDALEPLESDETGAVFDIARAPERITKDIADYIRSLS